MDLTDVQKSGFCHNAFLYLSFWTYSRPVVVPLLAWHSKCAVDSNIFVKYLSLLQKIPVCRRKIMLLVFIVCYGIAKCIREISIDQSHIDKSFISEKTIWLNYKKIIALKIA